MHVFVTVASTGSLSAAARKLNSSLTNVSRQLAALEDHVGTSLIARTTRRSGLTDAGRRYLETCRHVLDDLASVESELAGRSEGISGELTVTAPVVFGRLHLLPLVTRFLQAYPAVEARLLLVDRVVDLAEEGLDIAVRIGALPDSALVASKVGDLRMVTCAAPKYLKRYGQPRVPADLAGHTCIAFSNIARGGRWTFKSGAHGRRSVRINARLRVSTAEAAVDAAVAGLGVTRVLSYQAAAAVARRKLVSVLGDFDDTLVPIHIVQRPVRTPSRQVRRFIDFAVRELRTRTP